jgi:hypothetical protein
LTLFTFFLGVFRALRLFAAFTAPPTNGKDSAVFEACPPVATSIKSPNGPKGLLSDITFPKKDFWKSSTQVAILIFYLL